MKPDTRFPTKLDTVADAPEPLRSALMKKLPSGELVRFLLHAPAFSTGDEKMPATLLAVTKNGWLVAWETEDGSAALEMSDFNDTLLIELTSILLLGQLRISFAARNASHSVTMNFDTVGHEFYREATDLILAGIDPAITAEAEKDRNLSSMFEAWPLKFRNEAQRYSPRGQHLLGAIHWPAIYDESQRQLAFAGALLMTKRELVLISEAKESLRERRPEAPPDQVTKESSPEQETAEIITFVPRVRLADFQVRQQDRSAILALQIRGAHGEEKLEINFPSDRETSVSEAMKQMLPES
jgi:hypothetical protein